MMLLHEQAKFMELKKVWKVSLKLQYEVHGMTNIAIGQLFDNSCTFVCK